MHSSWPITMATPVPSPVSHNREIPDTKAMNRAQGQMAPGKSRLFTKEGVLDPGIVIGHGKYLKVNALCVGPSAFASVPLKRCTTALEFLDRFFQMLVRF